MALTLHGLRDVTSPDGLTPLERAQLYLAGRAFDGRDRRVEDRFVELPVSPEDLADGLDWDDGCLGANMLWTAAVYDGEVHAFDLWVHHADNGCLFTAGSTDQLAGRVQSTWMTPDLRAPYPRAAELDAAMHAVGRW
ncbi:MAG: hypothetical protein IPH44_27760 [Myxococcales bacterium]|nr:hypothetical protein [Myxococcales bacterium]MBK7196204.1 hypothetical protein [Myxococcales bacterium]